MKMYRVSLGGLITIKEHEILKSTDKTVWFKNEYFNGKSVEIRELKISTYSKWFNSLHEAREFVYEKLTRNVKNCKTRYDDATSELIYFLEETAFIPK